MIFSSFFPHFLSCCKMQTMKNYYEILGISQTATEQEIKTAYRKLSQKFHPDKNEGDKFFEEMFKKIQEAYEVLGNATERQKYDLQLAKNASKQHTTAKNNFVPVIEHFAVSPNQVYSGETITISWKVFNADKITISLLGEVEAQGETTIRLNNIHANEFVEIKIIATNTHINKSAEKVTQIANKTYLEIKEKVKREIKNTKGDEIINVKETKYASFYKGLLWYIKILLWCLTIISLVLLIIIGKR